MARISRAFWAVVSLEHLVVLEDQAADLVAQFVLDLTEEDLAGLVAAHLGDPVEGLAAIGHGFADLLVAGGEFFLLLGQIALNRLDVAFLLVEQVELLVEQVGPLVEPAALIANTGAKDLNLGFGRLATARRLVARPEVGLLTDQVGLAAGVVEDRPGLLACRF